jgi:hypothetical protein
MADGSIFRRLRGAVGNGLVWGVGWSAAAFALFAVLRVVGFFSEGATWLDEIAFAIKAGIIGFVAGTAFSGLIGLLYRGRRLSEISWVRFGLLAGIATGVFVPLFFQTMNLLSGDGLVPWGLVFDDSIWATVFGGTAAAVSLKLAQHTDTLLLGKRQDQRDVLVSADRAAAALERDTRERDAPARPSAED